MPEEKWQQKNNNTNNRQLSPFIFRQWFANWQCIWVPGGYVYGMIDGWKEGGKWPRSGEIIIIVDIYL